MKVTVCSMWTSPATARSVQTATSCTGWGLFSVPHASSIFATTHHSMHKSTTGAVLLTALALAILRHLRVAIVKSRGRTSRCLCLVCIQAPHFLYRHVRNSFWRGLSDSMFSF